MLCLASLWQLREQILSLRVCDFIYLRGYIYALLLESLQYTFYSWGKLKEKGGGGPEYSVAIYSSRVQHVTLQGGKFIPRAVIWCVDMAYINPEGAGMIKTLFCCIARENSPINFGLIAYKHGTQAAECLFPEIPG